MVAVISGRSHHMRLFPMSALDGRKTDTHKPAETKGCQTMTSGTFCQGAHMCFCVARKSQVLCYELFQSKKISHRKFQELQFQPISSGWPSSMSSFVEDSSRVPEMPLEERRSPIQDAPPTGPDTIVYGTRARGRSLCRRDLQYWISAMF